MEHSPSNEIERIQDAARGYVERGLSVIPLKDKVPAISWVEYQKRLPNAQEIDSWFKTERNLGIVTGELSGIAVVDFDTEDAYEDAKKRGLPHGPLVKTGRGYHLYCSYEPGVRNFQKRADLPGIDLRGEGGQAVAPPSRHANGNHYEWLVAFDQTPLPQLPEWLLAKTPEEKQPVKDLYTGAAPGNRNNTLTRLVGSWVNDGGGFDEILEQALLWNQSLDHPMSKAEVKRTIRSIYETHQRNVEELPTLVTDTRVAEYFSRNSDGVLYWSDAKKWLTYDGRRWNTDTPGGPFEQLKETIKALYEGARQIPDETRRQAFLRDIIKLESHRRQEILLDAASVIPGMIVSSAQLDRDPMILNCLNGTIDLKTGQLNAHDQKDLITRLVNIEFQPSAPCPVFHSFLNRVLDDKQELIDYLQRFVGYCLTGETTEQVLLFMYGTGANGKTTLANIIEMLLGDFASTSDSSLLMQRDNRNASNDLAGLRGSRLVKVSEFNDGERLAEATIKTLTGGDRVTCRFLYAEYFEYTPAFKIILLGNYKPKIRGRDHGIWRRIHLLPFNVTIPEGERDPNLMLKLKAELPGILVWAVEGCLKWQKEGLKPPDEVRREVEAYRFDEDVFSQWLDECCILGPECRASAKELFASFVSFSNWRHLSKTKFGRLLAESGLVKEKSSRSFWRGIGLIDSEERQYSLTDSGDQKY